MAQEPGAPAPGANRWVLVGVNAQGDSMFYDRQTVRRLAWGGVRTWARTVFGAPRQVQGYRTAVMLTLHEFDCREPRWRGLFLVLHDTAGVVVLTRANPRPMWVPEVPETFSEDACGAVCRAPACRQWSRNLRVGVIKIYPS